MSRVNLSRQVKTESGWKRVALERDSRGRIRWGNGEGRYLVEWREEGRRLRETAGATPAEALEVQKRKRLEYEYILELLCERVAPKKYAREVTPEDVKEFLSWRKSKGFDPGTTLCTDRVILHNFFSKLKMENPVKQVPRLARFARSQWRIPTLI